MVFVIMMGLAVFGSGLVTIDRFETEDNRFVLKASVHKEVLKQGKPEYTFNQ